MSVTWLVSQSPIGESNPDAPLNMSAMSVTADVSQPSIDPPVAAGSNAAAPRKALLRSVTPGGRVGGTAARALAPSKAPARLVMPRVPNESTPVIKLAPP